MWTTLFVSFNSSRDSVSFWSNWPGSLNHSEYFTCSTPLTLIHLSCTKYIKTLHPSTSLSFTLYLSASDIPSFCMTFLIGQIVQLEWPHVQPCSSNWSIQSLDKCSNNHVSDTDSPVAKCLCSTELYWVDEYFHQICCFISGLTCCRVDPISRDSYRLTSSLGLLVLVHYISVAIYCQCKSNPCNIKASTSTFANSCRL